MVVIDSRKERTWISVTSDGDAFINAICVPGHNIIQLVRHASGPGHVRHAPRPVQSRGENVIHHATGVADLETAGFYSSDRGRSDYVDSWKFSERVSLQDILGSMPLTPVVYEHMDHEMPPQT